jgi:hypothetical protein
VSAVETPLGAEEAREGVRIVAGLMGLVGMSFEQAALFDPIEREAALERIIGDGTDLDAIRARLNGVLYAFYVVFDATLAVSDENARRSAEEGDPFGVDLALLAELIETKLAEFTGLDTPETP